MTMNNDNIWNNGIDYIWQILEYYHVVQIDRTLAFARDATKMDQIQLIEFPRCHIIQILLVLLVVIIFVQYLTGAKDFDAIGIEYCGDIQFDLIILIGIGDKKAQKIIEKYWTCTTQAKMENIDMKREETIEKVLKI
eukprot:127836_1